MAKAKARSKANAKSKTTRKTTRKTTAARTATRKAKPKAKAKAAPKKAKARPKKKPLKTFLVTYHAPASAMKKMQKATKEEMAEGMKVWMRWARRCGKKLVEMGAPLKPGTNVKAKGRPTKSKRKLTGYSVLQAENLTAARALVKDHPHLAWTSGCEIELHEMQPMG